MTLDPTFVYSNYVEACLWTAMGAVAIAKSRPHRAGAMLGLALITFGISDIVETRTGAWYSPWWMLAWKATCVVAILACGAMLYRARRRKI